MDPFRSRAGLRVECRRRWPTRPRPVCDSAPQLLDERGTMLIVQSEFADADRTVRRLRRGGLRAEVVISQMIPFGPVLRARARWMETIGRLPVGRREEELVVIRR